MARAPVGLLPDRRREREAAPVLEARAALRSAWWKVRRYVLNRAAGTANVLVAAALRCLPNISMAR
jgi:hypothetical protein